MNTGEFTSNGIAHFGEFITALIEFLGYNTRIEWRKYFVYFVGNCHWHGNSLVGKLPGYFDTDSKRGIAGNGQNRGSFL
jgi:hypothetical protein